MRKTKLVVDFEVLHDVLCFVARYQCDNEIMWFLPVSRAWARRIIAKIQTQAQKQWADWDLEVTRLVN